jgi:hypothetical protein
MLFRNIDGSLIEIKKCNFINDKLYYNKIIELKNIELKNILLNLKKTFNY